MVETPNSVTVLGGVRRDGVVHSESRLARLAVEEADIDVEPESFERRMESLIKDAGFAPKRARFRTLDEMTRLTRAEIGEMFGVTKGTMDATVADVREEVIERTLGHYALFDHPMNFLAMAEFDAEPPADYRERFYFYELSYADPTPRNPGPKPPRYRYCVVTEALGADDRLGYAVCNIDIDRYESVEGVTDVLYEDEYFWSEARATEWHDLLTFVFDDASLSAAPAERLHPDAGDTR
jgi:hypothetical protein